MLCIVWFVLLFLTGAAVGSFLNVCIYRLPQQKSIIWPGSCCGRCLKPIAWHDNVPLLSYWLLRGRCRRCGAQFSIQYFLVELFTGLSFAGLFYLLVIANVHGFPSLQVEHDNIVQFGLFPPEAAAIFVHHALLMCFLIVATVCDWQSREIPLMVTMPGAVIGLVSALLWPWPWPWPVSAAAPPRLFAELPGLNAWQVARHFPPQGLYPWPVWGPLPDWLAPGDNWQTGLATGLAGLLVGTWLLRSIRFLFSKALGLEVMGLGDADIMMMAGCFVGWQPVVVGFFAAIFPALLLGVIQLVRSGDNTVAFGPALAVGVMTVWLAWAWVGPQMQFVFFDTGLLLFLVVSCAVFLVLASLVLRLRRRLRGELGTWENN